MVPHLVWLIFSLSFTTFCAYFRILNYNGYKMEDASDILYKSTALLCILSKYLLNLNSKYSRCPKLDGSAIANFGGGAIIEYTILKYT